MFFHSTPTCSVGVKKLGVPFKQSKHPLQALYNSRPSQLSLLTICLRGLFQSPNLSARADVLCCHNTAASLEIGQKISKAFLRNCLHIITVAWTTDPKQFQFAVFQFRKQREGDNCCRPSALVKACRQFKHFAFQ